MEEHTEATLERVLDVLSEIRSLLQVSTFLDVQKLLDTTLETNEEKQAYDLSDGKKTQAEIAKAVGVTQGCVSKWWRRWNRVGITVESTSFAKRQKKVFDLAAYSVRPGQTSGDIDEGP